MNSDSDFDMVRVVLVSSFSQVQTRLTLLILQFEEDSDFDSMDGKLVGLSFLLLITYQ